MHHSKWIFSALSKNALFSHPWGVILEIWTLKGAYQDYFVKLSEIALGCLFLAIL
jgi:hypothetical protein